MRTARAIGLSGFFLLVFVTWLLLPMTAGTTPTIAMVQTSSIPANLVPQAKTLFSKINTSFIHNEALIGQENKEHPYPDHRVAWLGRMKFLPDWRPGMAGH